MSLIFLLCYMCCIVGLVLCVFILKLYGVTLFFFFSCRRRHTRGALVTGVQTCALPIYKSRIILTHTNAEVRDLNLAARARLRDSAALGPDVEVKAERGAREFASGDRIMFLKNERGLGVKNGTLGK